MPQEKKEIPLIPLRDAFLCANCNTIGNDARVCWACSSRSLVSLAIALTWPRAEA
jgi:hypothetical protein